jgi:hypothetical protein
MVTGGHIMVNPRERCHPPMLVEVDHALVVRLRPEAARRDVPVVRLIHDLLDTIVRDGLTTAVLDADTALDDGDLPGA